MPANQDWMSRAESMLSQFIDGGGGGSGDGGDAAVRDPYPYSQVYSQLFVDNSSTSSSSSSCSSAYDSVYDRLLGCGCAADYGHQSGGGGGGSPCVSLFLQWVRLVLGGAIRAYLSSPLCLALLPMAAGAGLGFWMGRRRGGHSHAPAASMDAAAAGGKSFLASYASRLYSWLCLRMMLGLVLLDPRRCFGKSIIGSRDASGLLLEERDERDEKTRDELKAMESKRESGVDPQCVPRHIAVIMDGNRRYGEARYGNATRGHWDGSRTLIEFARWCMAEGVAVLTVYAFSTENWDRDPAEVSALMAIFRRYCDEIRAEAVERGIRVRVLSTEGERIPADVRAGIDVMVEETSRCRGFELNICLSYGGRGEIVNACRSIARDVRAGRLDADEVDEGHVRERMLTGSWCPDPDVVLRTSGEERLSNFLLWQVAYSEFFFLEKTWPELRKEDLLEVIRAFANGRKRRFGR